MTSRIVLTALCVIVVAASAPAFGQTSAGGSNGQMLYSAYCAFCHGSSGRGDGSLASSLKTRPADLTQIAARRQGSFPSEEVARIIEGRKPMRGHGDDMPAWGEALARSYDTLPVEERIRRLVAYLESIQIRAK